MTGLWLESNISIMNGNLIDKYRIDDVFALSSLSMIISMRDPLTQLFVLPVFLNSI